MASDTDPTSSRLASLARYQEHVPGEMAVLDDESTGRELNIRSHVLPADQTPAPAPAIPQHTLTFVYSGPIQGARRTAGGPWSPFDTAANGHVTIRPAGRSTTLRWTATRPVRTTSLYLAPTQLEDVGLQMGMAPSRVELRDRFNVADPVLRALARALHRMVVAGPDRDALYRESTRQSIATRLLREHGVYAPTTPGAGALSSDRLDEVTRYVQAHLDADLSLDDLAGEVGLSKYHFSRRFKARTGQSPYQFVIYERVRAARRLLRDTTRPLAQIALDVGFSSQSHLTRTFKRHVGTTPGRYRDAWRE
jgi:AraC family transcriptional regulator